MTIKNGEIADADEVLEEFFTRNGQTIFFNSLTLDLQGFFDGAGELPRDDYVNAGFIWSKNASDRADAVSSTALSVPSWTGGPYIVSDLYDDFEDASLDPNIWNVIDGPVSESSGSMLVGGSGGNSDNSVVVADQTSARDYKTLGGDSEILFWTGGNGGGGNNGTNYIGLSNNGAGSPVILTSEGGSPSGGLNGTFTIQIDNSAQMARYVKNGTTVGSWISISGLSQWRLYFRHQNGSAVGGNPGWRIFHLVDLKPGDLITQHYQSLAVTTPDIITGAAVYVPDTFATVNSDNASFEVSADNGSNFDAAQQSVLQRFTNTGTQFIVKVGAETKSSIDVTTANSNDYYSLFPIIKGVWGARWMDN